MDRLTQQLTVFFNVDLRLDKMIEMGSSKVNVYVSIFNLLNREQELGHWSTSGMADDDGWIGSEDGQAWVSNWLDSIQMYLLKIYIDLIAGARWSTKNRSWCKL